MSRDPSEVQMARQTARRLFKRFSFTGSQLGQYELSSFITETYQHLNIAYKPSGQDSKTLNKVLDANSDGKVTLEDLEQMCIRYLCDGISVGGDSYARTMSGKDNAQSRTSVQQPLINVSGSGNKQIFDRYAHQNQSVEHISSQLHQNRPQHVQQTKSVNNESQQITYTRTYNQTSIYQTRSSQHTSSHQNLNQQTSSHQNLNQQTTNQSQTQNNKATNNQSSSSSFKPYNQPQIKRQQQQPEKRQVKQTRQEKNTHHYSEQASQERQRDLPSNSGVNASHNPVNQSLSLSNTEHRPYTAEVQQYLQLARELFYKYALKETHTITANEVPDVLSETYETLGKSGYRPSPDDVAVWMKLCDGNEDGHVQYEDYEYFVVRSLERSGVSVYEQ